MKFQLRVFKRLAEVWEKNLDRWVIEAAESYFELGKVEEGARIERGVLFEGTTQNIRVGAGAQIRAGARIVCTDGNAHVNVGPGCIVHSGALLDTGPGGSITLAQSCSVNPGCVIYGHGGLSVGRYVRIAANSVIIPANHIFSSLERPITRQGLTKAGIVIEDDVWIAANVTILDGVTIGTGSVIAAGAVVTKSVAPLSVVGGVPARTLKSRKPDQ